MGGLMSKGNIPAHLKHCTLWKADRSPACRAVMMALDAMNLNINEVDVNMDKAEHKCPEIAVMNPLQTLPILRDRELILCDSNAIATYMATRYGGAESCRLVPTDPGGRALVDQMLHYNSGVLYPRFREATYPILYGGCRSLTTQSVCSIECTYCELETMLVGRTFLGGSWPSLADIMLSATVSSLNILMPIDKVKYPKVSSWLYRMSDQSCFITANKIGLNEFSKRIGELTIRESQSKAKLASSC